MPLILFIPLFAIFYQFSFSLHLWWRFWFYEDLHVVHFVCYPAPSLADGCNLQVHWLFLLVCSAEALRDGVGLDQFVEFLKKSVIIIAIDINIRETKVEIIYKSNKQAICVAIVMNIFVLRINYWLENVFSVKFLEFMSKQFSKTDTSA